MAPDVLLSAFGWQMPFHELPDIGERGQGHYGWDFQGPRRFLRPIRADLVRIAKRHLLFMRVATRDDVSLVQNRPPS
jgi:hypothetical protein